MRVDRESKCGCERKVLISHFVSSVMYLCVVALNTFTLRRESFYPHLDVNDLFIYFNEVITACVMALAQTRGL